MTSIDIKGHLRSLGCLKNYFLHIFLHFEIWFCQHDKVANVSNTNLFDLKMKYSKVKDAVILNLLFSKYKKKKKCSTLKEQNISVV